MAKRFQKRVKKGGRRGRLSELTRGVRQGGPLASAIVMGLEYTHVVNVTEGAPTSGAFNQYRLNSCYDPDLSGTGKQPLGFDQYSALYGRYRVLKATVDIYCTNRLDTGGNNYVFCVWPSAQSSITSDPESWLVQPMAKYKVGSLATGGGAIQHIKMSVDIARLLGVTSSEFRSEADYSAITSANPSRVAYLHVGIFGLGPTSVATSCQFVTKLTFLTEWSQPVTLALS